MENKTLSLSLTVDQINLVLTSLGKQPYDVSAGLIEEIKKQAVPQLQAPQAPTVVPDQTSAAS